MYDGANNDGIENIAIFIWKGGEVDKSCYDREHIQLVIFTSFPYIFIFILSIPTPSYSRPTSAIPG
jgi:hypothetical protein